MVLEDELKQLERCLREKDFKSARAFVHRINSASGYLGVEKIADLAYDFKNILDEPRPDSEKIEEGWAEIEHATKEFMNLSPDNLRTALDDWLRR